MTPTEQQIADELNALVPILGGAKRLAAFLERVLQAYRDQDIVWQIIDPTPEQLDDLQAVYQSQKALFKSEVAAF